MADIIDAASERETRERDAAISKAVIDLNYPAPEYENGEAVCVECGEPIPAERLKVAPACGLCLECAEEWAQEQVRLQGLAA
ncbi:TraR/DksA C4-type zinc finger protein [Desulfovibrio mangrovi]|uniref:TraR/DksA C4-type zinc finger protein n=1 Tax=Desulfovibrio mangrovi TaxID=2976983 RepID=UPI002247B7FD|nr:TraR/DksA C4-type zinc finger protein [Desulfovibrio mangrovi]UZP67702.1 TraR/DksA C4-type zinc finger protein [Desulfovibrio mangrovi]